MYLTGSPSTSASCVYVVTCVANVSFWFTEYVSVLSRPAKSCSTCTVGLLEYVRVRACVQAHVRALSSSSLRARNVCSAGYVSVCGTQRSILHLKVLACSFAQDANLQRARATVHARVHSRSTCLIEKGSCVYSLRIMQILPCRQKTYLPPLRRINGSFPENSLIRSALCFRHVTVKRKKARGNEWLNIPRHTDRHCHWSLRPSSILSWSFDVKVCCGTLHRGLC